MEELGDLAEAGLQKALDKSPSAEVRHRLRALLQRLQDPITSLAQIRNVHAVEVLELIGLPAAKRLLQALAQGASSARLTREAKAALARFPKP